MKNKLSKITMNVNNPKNKSVAVEFLVYGEKITAQNTFLITGTYFWYVLKKKKSIYRNRILQM